MNPESPPQHDVYFKHVFQDLTRARAFLEAVLPEDLRQDLDLTTLVPLRESYVSKSLANRVSDLVYQCSSREHQQFKICLLFEHKSRKKPYVRLQLLQYMLNHWEATKKQKGPLSPVVPVLIYHGRENWTPGQFKADFGPLPGYLEDFIPEFRFLFINLRKREGLAVLTRLKSLNAALLLLKHIWSSKALEARLLKLVILLSDDWNLLHASFVYIFTRHNFHPDKIDQLMNKLPPRVKKPFKSTLDQIAEMYTAKNKEKWIDIGQENTKKEQLRFWLHVKKFSVPYIADISGRSEEEILEDIKKWDL
jgi:hypothetical protein